MSEETLDVESITKQVFNLFPTIADPDLSYKDEYVTRRPRGAPKQKLEVPDNVYLIDALESDVELDVKKKRQICTIFRRLKMEMKYNEAINGLSVTFSVPYRQLHKLLEKANLL
mgnify:CR=1 FL=1